MGYDGKDRNGFVCDGSVAEGVVGYHHALDCVYIQVSKYGACGTLFCLLGRRQDPAVTAFSSRYEPAAYPFLSVCRTVCAEAVLDLPAGHSFFIDYRNKGKIFQPEKIRISVGDIGFFT